MIVLLCVVVSGETLVPPELLTRFSLQHGPADMNSPKPAEVVEFFSHQNRSQKAATEQLHLVADADEGRHRAD